MRPLLPDRVVAVYFVTVAGTLGEKRYTFRRFAVTTSSRPKAVCYVNRPSTFAMQAAGNTIRVRAPRRFVSVIGADRSFQSYAQSGRAIVWQ